ncbi:HIT family protein [Methanofollis ethanolicus]|uniref:HIT family protein n=1 Tax=Methanofollis ethanolicus TaxID=488124 RepID=UPI00082E2305|nr:HIT family protein [Methanofollis ethanolicus]
MNDDPLTGATCPFCDPSPADIVVQNTLAYARADAFPVSPGHTLIVPFRHVSSFFEATEAERVALLDLLCRCRDALEERYHPDGWNIGINVGPAAGQTVPHLHIHLIPRYAGDVPDPRGGVRGVVPEKKMY